MWTLTRSQLRRLTCIMLHRDSPQTVPWTVPRSGRSHATSVPIENGALGPGMGIGGTDFVFFECIVTLLTRDG